MIACDGANPDLYRGAQTVSTGGSLADRRSRLSFKCGRCSVPFQTDTEDDPMMVQPFRECNAGLPVPVYSVQAPSGGTSMYCGFTACQPVRPLPVTGALPGSVSSRVRGDGVGGVGLERQRPSLVIRHPWSSLVILGHPWSSLVILGHPWSSLKEALPHRQGGTRWPKKGWT